MTNLKNRVLFPDKDQALRAWAHLVRENREQVERFREQPEQADFYAPTAGIFKTNPDHSSDPSLSILLDLVEPGETWLDIGAGGGRNAIPLAGKAGRVIAVEPSPGMTANLEESVKSMGLGNISIMRQRWPGNEKFRTDVALISHVGYDIEDIGSFLDAMEASARRLCVAVMLESAPASAAARFWPLIHGEERAPLPALRQFLILQIARGRHFEVRLTTRTSLWGNSSDVRLPFLRQQLFIRPGGNKDLQLQKLLEQQPRVADNRPNPAIAGIVTWRS